MINKNNIRKGLGALSLALAITGAGITLQGCSKETPKQNTTQETNTQDTTQEENKQYPTIQEMLTFVKSQDIEQLYVFPEIVQLSEDSYGLKTPRGFKAYRVDENVKQLGMTGIEYDENDNLITIFPTNYTAEDCKGYIGVHPYIQLLSFYADKELEEIPKDMIPYYEQVIDFMDAFKEHVGEAYAEYYGTAAVK